MDGIDERTAVSDYIKARLTEEQREKGRGYQADVARATGLSTSYIANLINHPHKGVGFEAAPAFASFWNMSLPQLIETASATAKARPVVAAESRHPNLTTAIEFLRSRDGLSDQVVEEARGLARHGRDFSVGTWVVLLTDLAQIHRSTTGRPRDPR
mgnify:CR=1 FL=1